MDGIKFDAVARRFVAKLTRRDAAKGLAVGAAAAISGTGLEEAVGARRCLRAGRPCDTNSQCCPKKTGRLCRQPDPPSGSEVCCSMEGRKCGGQNQDGPVQPQCCFPLECSSRKGGTCVRRK